MNQRQIERINELARKARSPEGLTKAEKEEQAFLRRAYIDAVVRNLKGQLDRTVIVDGEGHRRKLKERDKEA